MELSIDPEVAKTVNSVIDTVISQVESKQSPRTPRTPRSPTTLRTSAEWYSNQPRRNMCDPDGWRQLGNFETQVHFWHNVPITCEEFRWRLAHSSISKMDNLYPFGKNAPT